MTVDVDVNPWPRRFRFWLLLAVVTLGFAVAAMEKWREAEAYRLWGTAYDRLAYFLDPLRDGTLETVQLGRKIRHLWDLEQEHRQLEEDYTRLQLDHQLAVEQLGRVERLSGLGQWLGPPELSFLTADVTGIETSEDSAVLVVNRGTADGVRPRDPVVALGGLVGIVRETSRRSARVQAIADPASGIGAVVRQSRARGIAYGSGRGRPLEFVPENEALPIQSGDVLVTSGFLNSVYPKGIVVGTVRGQALNAQGLPYGEVDPAVPFDSVEEVLIIIPKERIATEDAGTSASLGQYAIRMPNQPALEDESTTAPENVAPATTGTLTRSDALTSAPARVSTTAPAQGATP